MAIGDLLAQINGEAPRPAPSTYNGTTVKRKADDELPRNYDKSSRLSTTSTPASRPVKPVRQPAGPTSTVSASKPGFDQKSSNGNTTPSLSSTIPAKSNAASSQPMQPAPLKKGSFKEIMARAAAARAVAPQFGKIQHKALPKEDPKLSAKNGNGTGKRTSPPTRNGKSADANGGKKSRQTSPEPNKKVKKPAPTTGYKGTARPALSEPEKKVKKAPAPTLGYTGTARPSEVAKRPPPSSSYRSTRERDRGPSYSRYSYVSEDEEEEEDYYESDVSDMEAGLDEVDEEEERALREARKEDKKAQMEEERLRQEKRARLQGLAKKRR